MDDAHLEADAAGAKHSDISKLNDIAVAARSTGMILLGGGVAKHQMCNANSWRDGADYAVYINTAQEFDGCDSGASPDEAVSWGKIRAEAQPVKVSADASIVFPLLVAETFAARANQTTAGEEEETKEQKPYQICQEL